VIHLLTQTEMGCQNVKMENHQNNMVSDMEALQIYPCLERLDVFCLFWDLVCCESEGESVRVKDILLLFQLKV